MLKEHYESQMKDEFNPQLSQKLEAVQVLLDHENEGKESGDEIQTNQI
jgi:hypothetical protein